jgi:uncharacterized protein (DUF342 family)
MIDDVLKHLRCTIIDYPLRNPRAPLKVSGNLVLQEDAVHAEIEARGHIIVHGSAEHCRLGAELGSVFLLYGSMEYTKIAAGMNIYVKHAANSSLVAGGDIVIEKSVLGSVLRCGGKVVSESDDGRIVGGRVEARDQVRVHTLGSSDGVSTEVVVVRSKGSVAFDEVFPGVRFQIGDFTTAVTTHMTEGFAVVDDGRIRFRLRVPA